MTYICSQTTTSHDTHKLICHCVLTVFPAQTKIHHIHKHKLLIHLSPWSPGSMIPNPCMDDKTESVLSLRLSLSCTINYVPFMHISPDPNPSDSAIIIAFSGRIATQMTVSLCGRYTPFDFLPKQSVLSQYLHIYSQKSSSQRTDILQILHYLL